MEFRTEINFYSIWVDFFFWAIQLRSDGIKHFLKSYQPHFIIDPCFRQSTLKWALLKHKQTITRYLAQFLLIVVRTMLYRVLYLIMNHDGFWPHSRSYYVFCYTNEHVTARYFIGAKRRDSLNALVPKTKSPSKFLNTT